MQTQRKLRLRRRALAILIGLAVACLAAEGGMRILLFWDTLAKNRLAIMLRRPGYYADLARDDVYWKLKRIWTPPEERERLERFTQTTGWVGALINHKTLVMADERRVGDRRPVLLYGDSFAESVTTPAEAWQGLLERAPEGRTHALVNFGTSGFGTDQSLMMLEATINRYATRDPLVIFSLFLDEDPDRTMLNFRGMPKPRFELQDGELVFLPLHEQSAYAWFENHPPGVVSYLWRMCGGAAGPLPLSWQSRLSPVASDEQVIALNRALLTRMHRRLEAMHIEHIVLGFHGRMMLENPQPHQWREDFVREICRDLDVNILCSGPYLLSAVNSNLKRLGPSLFVTEGPGEGHYNARGNRAVFEAFLQAIQGRVDREDTSGVGASLRSDPGTREPSQILQLCSLGQPAELHFPVGGVARYFREYVDRSGEGTQLLGLHPEFELPVRLEWRIEQRTRFVAQARAVRTAQESETQESVHLRLLVDGITVRSVDLVPGDPALRLDHELPAFCTFALEVEPVEGFANTCWVQLERPAFR